MNDVRRFRWNALPDFATSRWVERDYVDGEWTDRHGEGRSGASNEEIKDCRSIVLEMIREAQRRSECNRADVADRARDAALSERDQLRRQLARLRNASLGAAMRQEQSARQQNLLLAGSGGQTASLSQSLGAPSAPPPPAFGGGTRVRRASLR